MPRVFLKKKNRGGHKVYHCEKCRKPVEPGTRYFFWKPNFGMPHFQHEECGHPLRSQTSSSKMGELWDAVDALDLSACASVEDIQSELSGVAEAARSVSEQYAESASNIESAFTSGNSTSEACTATAEALESWATEIDNWSPDTDEPKGDDPEEMESWLEQIREEASELANSHPEYEG